MDKIARDFQDKGVVFYMLYTREPHAGQQMRNFDFTDKVQTKTHEQRVEYALGMLETYSQHRPILVDTFGKDCVQMTIGGNRPNSLILVDEEGKLVLWQRWSDSDELRKKLQELTGGN